ncbi:hypothetical protein HX846_37825, partial [Pseudomonas sp. K5002]|nr:hypothetical protein [Pseudomonas sp. K5002]
TALSSASGAQKTAETAQSSADTALASATSARNVADKAQSTADAAGRSANDALQAATTSQASADNALDAASNAQKGAVAAQHTADAAKATADIATGQLKGLDDGQTVVQRIDAAIRSAAGVASEFVAKALGGGSIVGSDGQPTAPAYAISQINADGSIQPAPQLHDNVGAALTALDHNVGTVNAAVNRQGAALGALGEGVRALRDDSVVWDEASGAYTAGRGADRNEPARIGNLAAGVAPSDAVNKGQLDTVATTAS